MTTRQIPASMQGTYDKAMTGRSRGSAVKAMCCECVSYDRNEVSLCLDTGCPLYLYRPFRSPLAVRRARAAVQQAAQAANGGG